MRLGILSDTHDNIDRTARALERLCDEGADALVHCGDLTRPRIVTLCSIMKCAYVYGNNDYEREALERAILTTGGINLGDGGIFTLEGRRIAVTHGHLASMHRSLLRECPDYLLFGHTHSYMDERDGPTRTINPGALHRALEFSVVLLDLATDVSQKIVIP